MANNKISRKGLIMNINLVRLFLLKLHLPRLTAKTFLSNIWSSVFPSDYWKWITKDSEISASADGGPRSWVRSCGTLCSAHVSAELASNISPNPSEVISKVSEQEIFKISRFSGQNRVDWGGTGVSEIFLILIFLFMLLESPLKNSRPYDKSSWDIFEIRLFSSQNRVN